MPKYDYDIELMRETLEEEATEWFELVLQGFNEPPAWLWWVIYDAGVEVEQIGELCANPDEWLARMLKTPIVEQIDYASHPQIDTYTMARTVWIETE
jgi:hypothetical protein